MCRQAWYYLGIFVADCERRVVNINPVFENRLGDLLALVSMVALHLAPAMVMIAI